MNKNLLQRTLTASLAIPVVVGMILGHPYTYFLLFGIISSLALLEFHLLVQKNNVFPNKIFGFLGHNMGYIISFFITQEKFTNNGLIGGSLMLWIACLVYSLYQYQGNPFTNLSYQIFSWAYITLPFCLLHQIAFEQNNYQPYLVLGLLILVWSNDIGAFFVGRTWGKRKLFQRVSPKKSWEGAVGGGLITVLTGYLFSHYLPLLTPKKWMLIALSIAILGPYGDLLASLLKRTVQTKDSGGLLPGHGGFLDRFDSLILIIPMVWCILKFL